MIEEGLMLNGMVVFMLGFCIVMLVIGILGRDKTKH